MIDCLRCHRHRPNKARGLCPSCYDYARRHGALDAYPTAPTNNPDLWVCDCPTAQPDRSSVWARLPGRRKCDRCNRVIWT